MVDLGTVFWHSVIPFEVELENPTLRDVTIRAVRSSCGCTLLRQDLENQIVRGKKSLTISGDLATGSRPGQAKHSIIVQTADGNESSLQLSLEVEASYQVNPARLVFENVDITTSARHRGAAEFRAAGAHIIEHATDASWLRVQSETTNELTALGIEVLPHLLPFGASTGHIIVGTDDMYCPKFSIVVSAKGTARIRPAPAVVMLSKKRTSTTTIIRNDGERPEISDIVFPSDWLSVSWHEDTIEIAAREPVAWPLPIWVWDCEGDATKVLVIQDPEVE